MKKKKPPPSLKALPAGPLAALQIEVEQLQTDQETIRQLMIDLQKMLAMVLHGMDTLSDQLRRLKA